MASSVLERLIKASNLGVTGWAGLKKFISVPTRKYGNQAQADRIHCPSSDNLRHMAA
jgi:hypothetical protein